MSASLKYKNASWRVSYNTHITVDDHWNRKEWCHGNCKEWWATIGTEIWLFGSKEEATHFYLTWS